MQIPKRVAVLLLAGILLLVIGSNVPTDRFCRNPERMEPPELLAVFDQYIVAEGEQRTFQGGKNRKLVIRPLDRGESRTNGLHFFAIMERFASDQQMGKISCFELPNVGVRHVIVATGESPEKETDIARADRSELAGFPRLLNRPYALFNQPRYECGNRVRK